MFCDSPAMGYTSLSFPLQAPDTAGRMRFMGLDFDALTTPEVVQALTTYAHTGQPLSYVVTPNVDHMVRLEAEPDLRPLYTGAGMTICDSRILELLAKFEGRTLPVTAGSDLTELLLRDHIKPNDRIVIIGADGDVVERLIQDFGFSNIAWHEPPMGMRNKPEAIEAAAQFLIDHNEYFAFICVGSPQQELVAQKAVEIGGGRGIALCCGASLDFLVGKVDRAPLWMRRNRLEWLHRLLSQPGRLWRRYLIDGPRIFRIWWKYKGQ